MITAQCCICLLVIPGCSVRYRILVNTLLLYHFSTGYLSWLICTKLFSLFLCEGCLTALLGITEADLRDVGDQRPGLFTTQPKQDL